MNKWKALENVLNDQHENVPKELWSDEEFVFHACHWNGFNFKYADPALKSSKKFVLKIIKYWGYSFEYADCNLKKDKKFILEGVLFNASIIKYADSILQNDKDFINDVLKVTKHASEYVGTQIKENNFK